MSKSDLGVLLKRATGGIFSHRNELYQQSDGVAMGNPLAPTLANFFLGHLEKQLISPEITNTNYPVLYTIDMLMMSFAYFVNVVIIKLLC